MKPVQPTYASAALQIKALRILRAGVQKILDPYAINATQWAILGVLAKEPAGLTLAAVARILEVKAPLVTILVSPLEVLGWLCQAKGETDRRAKRMLITEQGCVAMQEIETALVSRGARMFRGVSEADMIAYHKVLNAIIDSQSET